MRGNSSSFCRLWVLSFWIHINAELLCLDSLQASANSSVLIKAGQLTNAEARQGYLESRLLHCLFSPHCDSWHTALHFSFSSCSGCIIKGETSTCHSVRRFITVGESGKTCIQACMEELVLRKEIVETPDIERSNSNATSRGKISAHTPSISLENANLTRSNATTRYLCWAVAFVPPAKSISTMQLFNWCRNLPCGACNKSLQFCKLMNSIHRLWISIHIHWVVAGCHIFDRFFSVWIAHKIISPIFSAKVSATDSNSTATWQGCLYRACDDLSLTKAALPWTFGSMTS